MECTRSSFKIRMIYAFSNKNTHYLRVIYAIYYLFTHNIPRIYSKNTQKIRKKYAEGVLYTHTTDVRIFCVNKKTRMIRNITHKIRMEQFADGDRRNGAGVLALGRRCHRHVEGRRGKCGKGDGGEGEWGRLW